MFKYHLILTLALSLFSLNHFASATDYQGNKEDSLVIRHSFYVDVYFSLFNRLNGETFQTATTVGARHNTLGLNIAQYGLHLSNQRLRANLTLHAGDIALATWDDTFNYIQEANVGFKILPELWLDAGFFTTHIGTESFLPKNNYTSSTAVASFNEPFYQAGARLTYSGIKNLSAELWLLNGYNLFIDQNEKKSVGALLSYQLSQQLSITYTNILGDEALAGSDTSQYRIYQNLYLNYQIGEDFFLTAGGDLGIQNEKWEQQSRQLFMYNYLVVARYNFLPKWGATFRFERFKDQNGFISGNFNTMSNQLEGFDINGYTINVEYRPDDRMFLRAEYRWMDSPHNYLAFEGQNNRSELMINLGFYLNTL